MSISYTLKFGLSLVMTGLLLRSAPRECNTTSQVHCWVIEKVQR
jgi:hypothetical protein